MPINRPVTTMMECHWLGSGQNFHSPAAPALDPISSFALSMFRSCSFRLQVCVSACRFPCDLLCVLSANRSLAALSLASPLLRIANELRPQRLPAFVSSLREQASTRSFSACGSRLAFEAHQVYPYSHQIGSLANSSGANRMRTANVHATCSNCTLPAPEAVHHMARALSAGLRT